MKATTEEEAREEANFFWKTANSASKTPLFYCADIEEDTFVKSNTEIICKTFAETLRKLGAQKIGIYINTKYSYAVNSIKLYDFIWVPRYGKNDGNIPSEEYLPKYKCDLWQYTSNGKLDGCNARVDLSILFGNKDLNWFIKGVN